MIPRHKQLKEIEDMIRIVGRKLLDEMYRENAEPYSENSLNELKKAFDNLQWAKDLIEEVREYGKMLRDDIRMHGLTKFSTQTLEEKDK